MKSSPEMTASPSLSLLTTQKQMYLGKCRIPVALEGENKSHDKKVPLATELICYLMATYDWIPTSLPSLQLHQELTTTSRPTDRTWTRIRTTCMYRRSATALFKQRTHPVAAVISTWLHLYTRPNDDDGVLNVYHYCITGQTAPCTIVSTYSPKRNQPYSSR